MSKKSFWRAWWPAIALVVLSLVPMFAGTARIASLSQGGPVTADNQRFFASPIPVVIHIVGASLYTLVGAFQFLTAARLRAPRWHRVAGRVLFVAGLAAALSGLWMTNFYPLPHDLQGPLLFAVRWAVGLGMLASLVLAWVYIVKRRIKEHKAWAIRAYALGQGAGTQVFVFLPWALLVGQASGLTYDLLMTLAWIINLVVAEIVIRREKSAVPPARSRQSVELS